MRGLEAGGHGACLRSNKEAGVAGAGEQERPGRRWSPRECGGTDRLGPPGPSRQTALLFSLSKARGAGAALFRHTFERDPAGCGMERRLEEVRCLSHADARGRPSVGCGVGLWIGFAGYADGSDVGCERNGVNGRVSGLRDWEGIY